MSKLRALFRSAMIHLLAIIFAISPNVYAAPGFFYSPQMEDYRPQAPAFDIVKQARAHKPSRFNGVNGNYIDAFYDQFGRLSMMQSSNGNQYVLVFADMFAKAASKIIVNGVEESLPLKRHAASKSAMEKSYYFYLDADYDTLVGEYSDFIYSYQYSQSGNFTDKSFATAEILSYIAEGAALGSIVGAICAELTGADFMMAELYMLGIALGGTAGAAFVVSWNAGYSFGTYLYQGPISSWLYAPGYHP